MHPIRLFPATYLILAKYEVIYHPGQVKTSCDLVCQVGLNRILIGQRKKAPGPGGLGGVIRNHRGDWIIGFYQQRSPCQPNPGKVINGEAGSSDANTHISGAE